MTTIERSHGARARRDVETLELAFARAEREREQLQHLKSTGRPWAALDFDPKENNVSDIPKTDLGLRESDGIDSTGFEKPSSKDYNRNVGRLPNAPLSGGSRQAAYDALLKPGKAVD